MSLLSHELLGDSAYPRYACDLCDRGGLSSFDVVGVKAQEGVQLLHPGDAHRHICRTCLKALVTLAMEPQP